MNELTKMISHATSHACNGTQPVNKEIFNDLLALCAKTCQSCANCCGQCGYGHCTANGAVANECATIIRQVQSQGM